MSRRDGTFTPVKIDRNAHIVAFINSKTMSVFVYIAYICRRKLCIIKIFSLKYRIHTGRIFTYKFRLNSINQNNFEHQCFDTQLWRVKCILNLRQTILHLQRLKVKCDIYLKMLCFSLRIKSWHNICEWKLIKLQILCSNEFSYIFRLHENLSF